MNSSLQPRLVICLLCTLILIAVSPCRLAAATDTPAQGTSQGSSPLKYKVISGFKEEFNAALQLHLSKGWIPVGGVSVTTWNNTPYFAQLLSKSSAQ